LNGEFSERPARVVAHANVGSRIKIANNDRQKSRECWSNLPIARARKFAQQRKAGMQEVKVLCTANEIAHFNKININGHLFQKIFMQKRNESAIGHQRFNTRAQSWQSHMISAAKEKKYRKNLQAKS
jgi:hypothetical protein